MRAVPTTDHGAGTGCPQRRLTAALVLLAAAVLLASLTSPLANTALAQDDSAQVTPENVEGADLNREQCDEADGIWAGGFCRDYDEEKAAELVNEANAQTDAENEDKANSEGGVKGTDLSEEECREADGFPAGDDCRNFDEEKAKDIIGERDSGQDPSNPDEQSQNDEQSGSDAGPLANMIMGAWGKIWQVFMDRVEARAEDRSEQVAGQLTEGRYMTDPPNTKLDGIYDDTANWVKPGAIALMLLLGLSMILRSADFNTAYAAQYGIPKIFAVIIGIAFMPDLIALAADLSQSMAESIVDEQAVADGYEKLIVGNFGRPVGLTILALIIKLILGVMILFAIAVKTLVFGILYVIGPLAIFFYAVPSLAEIAAAWMKGVLACFAISIIWALIFGIGFRFVGDPTIIASGESSSFSLLPLLLSIGVLWLAWKIPWWVFGLAFASYKPGGGRGVLGSAAALTTIVRTMTKIGK